MTATNALTPSPVATANGCLAQAPMRMVRMPATNAVTAATAVKPRDVAAGIGPGEDQRVQHHDVAHGEEGREAAADLARVRWIRVR